MDNIDGALAFKATLDIDNFKVSSDAMEQRIRQVSGSAVSESAKMEESIQNFAVNGARYITSYLVGQGMYGLLQSIATTRGQFQQLEIAFGTMLGSESKAKTLMDQMVQTAAKTPFDLMGVAGGAKQLLAYGASADKVNDTLVRLGNIASGLSIPLNDIVYLYGTTMVQGRLYAQDVRQFTGRGIPLVRELATMYGKTAEEINAMVSEGKIGFPEVEKVINKLTNSGGQFYNLMEKQSASLTGMIANLGDAWDSALNKIGTDNQDTFAAAIGGATTLVENMDDVLRIVKAVAVAYGSYKAAIILNTLATKGYTGVALLDNTARQAKLALLKADAALTGQNIAQTKAMTAAQEAHVASLQRELTAEQLANVQKQIRIATIQGLLTAQQQEYLSNLNVTTSSANYEAVAMGVLTVEQRLAVSKLDMSAKSAVYRAALEQEVAARTQNNAATLNAMRTDVKAAAVKMESARTDAIIAMQKKEEARYNLYLATTSGTAAQAELASKKLVAAEENQALARKAALATQSDFYAKKKLLEATASQQSAAASAVDTTAKVTQGSVTSVLTAITTKCTLAMKSLWASMMTNPIGWILGLVGALVSVLTLFSSSEEEATDAMGEFQDTTKKEIDNLNLLMGILQNTSASTKAHKDAIERINAICKEYNKTLLDENATLDEQKKKYQELKDAIQETTAEKIRAKYTEQALQQQAEDNKTALEDLKEAAKDAEQVIGTVQSPTTGIAKNITQDSKNIQNASQAVWDGVESMAVDAADKLKGLTGKAYSDAFNSSLNSIIQAVQKATGATDKEMAAFKVTLSSYLTNIANSAKTTQATIAKVDKQTEAFFKPKDTSGVKASVADVSMSFSDLEAKAQETQKQIDAINAKKVKVDTDNTKLKELKELLDSINGTISKKEAGLNTEAGISARIKQLKDERANVEINGSKYKDLTKQITALENKLPKTQTKNANAADKAENKNDQLKQKQLEADRKLEEARISIMEEGYAKRKATLDLQHKRNLEEIDKEERELEKARKEAGKKGLTGSEKQGFNERRNLENKSYNKDQNKLFDGEVAYKKEQYELYFKWVKNMGAEVANSQFATLLQGGNSYKEYVEKQIASLKEKQSAGGLSEGESNQLITLNMQYDEITGAKSAMDQFKESVTRTIGQAQTLAEKLEAVANARAKLDNGETGIVGADEKAEASLFISQEEEKNQQEIQDQLLANYRTFEEQKKSIQDQYSLLRNEAQKMNDQERLNQVNKGEAEALSALNAQMLMQSESWKNLFTDLDSLSAGEISQLLSDIENQLKNADLKLSPVDMKALTDSLNKAKDELVQKNPFKAIGKFYDDYVKAKKKLAEAKNKVNNGTGTDKDVKEAESEVKKASAGVFKSIGVVTDAATECGNSLASMFDALGMGDAAEGLGTAIELMGQLGNAAQGVGKLMSGDIIGGITGIVSSVSSVVGIFANLHDSKYEKKIQNLQKEIDALERGYSRLERAYNNTYWTFSDSQRDSYEKNINLIENQISALQKQADVAKKSWNFVEYGKLTKQIQELQKALSQAKEGDDMFGLYQQQKENLKKQQEDIQKQIQAEKDKKKTDNGKIKDWENKIEDINQQIEDLDQAMMETLAGTDVKSAIDEFADALVDAYCQGEDAAEALGDKTKEVLKKAVVDALKRQFLAKAINDAVAYLGTAMEDGVLSDDEKAKFESMVQAGADTFNAALGAVGDWIKDLDDNTETDPLTGAVNSMSEETGGLIAGRFNVFIINQAEQTSLMRNSLAYQAEIAQNTKVSANELSEIKSTLKRIENKDSSLLSQGIS